jgi:hypothetical protein
LEPFRNPFAPGAGTPPPELAGRNSVLEEMEIALARLRGGFANRSAILVGLRGVGKTVLLNRIREIAEKHGYQTVSVEAQEKKSLPALLVPPLRGTLLALDSAKDRHEKVKRALRVLKSFAGIFKAKFTLNEQIDVELGIDPELGIADSGDLEHDVAELLVAVAEAARARDAAVCLLVDELQYLSEKDLGALIMGLHQVAQRMLPLILVGAGLPLILGLAGRSKSYAERLFSFPLIGPLDRNSAISALQVPAEAQHVRFDESALDLILRKTECYPYFVQQWGYEAWNAAPKPLITGKDVDAATAKAIRQLDQGFFRVRFDRLTKREKDYLFAMVQVGGGQQRSGDIAEKLRVKVSSIGPLRSSLIKKGMIYSPAHGDNAFTVPLFDEFLKRQQSGLTE